MFVIHFVIRFVVCFVIRLSVSHRSHLAWLGTTGLVLLSLLLELRAVIDAKAFEGSHFVEQYFLCSLCP